MTEPMVRKHNKRKVYRPLNYCVPRLMFSPFLSLGSQPLPNQTPQLAHHDCPDTKLKHALGAEGCAGQSRPNTFSQKDETRIADFFKMTSISTSLTWEPILVGRSRKGGLGKSTTFRMKVVLCVCKLYLVSPGLSLRRSTYKKEREEEGNKNLRKISRELDFEQT